MSFVIKSDVQVGKRELNNKEKRGKKYPLVTVLPSCSLERIDFWDLPDAMQPLGCNLTSIHTY